MNELHTTPATACDEATVRDNTDGAGGVPRSESQVAVVNPERNQLRFDQLGFDLRTYPPTQSAAYTPTYTQYSIHTHHTDTRPRVASNGPLVADCALHAAALICGFERGRLYIIINLLPYT